MLKGTVALLLASLSIAACAGPPDPWPDWTGHERFDRYYLHRDSPFQPRGDLFDRP
jgi:hypothetical protein